VASVGCPEASSVYATDPGAYSIRGVDLVKGNYNQPAGAPNVLPAHILLAQQKSSSLQLAWQLALMLLAVLNLHLQLRVSQAAVCCLARCTLQPSYAASVHQLHTATAHTRGGFGAALSYLTRHVGVCHLPSFSSQKTATCSE
jgi:hypothetical protein